MPADAPALSAAGRDVPVQTRFAADAEACWRAVADADPRFDGRFVYAVRTTGVYCRPICSARRPLRAHVRFFDAPELAEAAGYRPCRRCRPNETGAASAGFDARETRGAVLFVDMLGASPAMMRASPREAAWRAVRFFSDLQATVGAHGGAVEKFLGDGALIWFEQRGDALDNEARAALRCAIELRDREAGGGWDGLRQGLHYGRVGAATVRSSAGERSELLGHTLNAAKRLEQATRRLDVRLLVSDDAVRAAGAAAAALGLRRLGRPLRLRGCRALAAWVG